MPGKKKNQAPSFSAVTIDDPAEFAGLDLDYVIVGKYGRGDQLSFRMLTIY
jgi:hypothetical protein